MSWEQAAPATIKPGINFQLANHSFPTRGIGLEDWIIGDSENFSRHGLLATAFLNRKMQHIVIAFNVIADIEICDEMLQHAHDFALHIKDQARELEYSVSYTGKQLGASLAMICASDDKLTAHCFQPKPVQLNEGFYPNIYQYVMNEAEAI